MDKTVDGQNGMLWPGTSLADWARSPRDAFDAWLAGAVVALARQFRASSCTTYRSYFSVWLDYLAARGSSFLEAGPAEAAGFFAEHDFAPVTRRRYLQLLDRVYRSLIALGWAGGNPLVAELRRERLLARPEPVALDDTEVARLRDAVARLPGWKGARDQAMLALLVDAGLRANELVALRWAAVRPEFAVEVSPAGVHRRHTSLLLPGPGRLAWTAWERDHATWGVTSLVAVPSSKAGRQYSEDGLFNRIDVWLAAAGLTPEERGANLLRNTFARRALARYAPLQVQEFLGHEELRATLRHAGEPEVGAPRLPA